MPGYGMPPPYYGPPGQPGYANGGPAPGMYSQGPGPSPYPPYGGPHPYYDQNPWGMGMQPPHLQSQNSFSQSQYMGNNPQGQPG